jgi:prepilin-type N-terminal cleavage/methylation domain-containing protein
MVMKKSFTLIELLVSVAIIALLIGVAIPSVPIYREKAEVDAAAREIKDLILKTRSMALAPDPTSYHYVFVLNTDSVSRDYYDPWIDPSTTTPVCPDLAKEGGYCIAKVFTTGEVEPGVPKTKRIKIEQDKIDIRDLHIDAYPITTEKLDSPPYSDSNLFKIHFRSWDGTVGFNGMFWDVNTYSGDPPPDYDEWEKLWTTDTVPKVPKITIKVGNAQKEIEINKYTGEIYIK